MVLVKMHAKVPKNRKIVVTIPETIPVDASVELQVAFHEECTDPAREIDGDRGIPGNVEGQSLLDEDHVVIMPPRECRVIRGRITGKGVAEPKPIVEFENLDIDG
jgi:hypothetical protein